MAKVSIIIPVYNVEKYLRQCLDSVVNQTLREIEIICVDDGSTDGSSEILAEYAARDSRIKVVARAHSNAGAARNAGMSVATGEYLAFVDSDDIADVSAFMRAYNKGKQDYADVVFFGYSCFDSETGKRFPGRPIADTARNLAQPFSPKELGEALFTTFNYAPWNRIVRRSFVLENGIVFQELPRSNDLRFGCEVLALARRISWIDAVLYGYRTNRTGNLQSSMEATPTTLCEAWSSLADVLSRHGKLNEVATSVATAGVGSLFYTLNTWKDARPYNACYAYLKRMCMDHPFFGSLEEGQIRNSQTLAYYSMLRQSGNAEEFLLLQENYNCNRLSKWLKENVAYRSQINNLRTLLESGRSSGDVPILLVITGQDAVRLTDTRYSIREQVLQKIEVVELGDGTPEAIANTVGKSSAKLVCFLRAGQKFCTPYDLQLQVLDLQLNGPLYHRRPLRDLFGTVIRKADVTDAVCAFAAWPEDALLEQILLPEGLLERISRIVYALDALDLHAQSGHLYELLGKVIQKHRDHGVRKMVCRMLHDSDYEHYREFLSDSAWKTYRPLLDEVYNLAWENVPLKNPGYSQSRIQDSGRQPRLTYVVPSMNTALYLPRCIESIRQQQFVDIEIICIDDGSWDETGAIMDRYAQRDARIRVVHQKNHGLGESRNIAMRMARGEYISFVDGDDWLSPETAATVVDIADCHRLDFCSYDMRGFNYQTRQEVSFFWNVNRQLAYIPVNKVISLSDLKCLRLSVSACLSLYRLSFLRGNNLCFSRIGYGEDMIFTFAVLAKARRFMVLNRKFYHYRRGQPASMVSRLSAGNNTGDAMAVQQEKYFALREVYNKIYKASRSEHLMKLFRENVIIDLLFYAERSKSIQRLFAAGLWRDFDMHLITEGDVSADLYRRKLAMEELLQTIKEESSVPLSSQVVINAPRPSFIKRRKLNDIRKRRATSSHDLFIVTGQLNSTANEPIDSWTFFEWLQANGIPSRYVIWKKHVYYKRLQEKGKLKDVVALEGDGVADYEFLDRLGDLLPRTLAVVQENSALNYGIRKWMIEETDIAHVFLQHGVFFTSFSPAVARVLGQFTYVNVSSDRERRFILDRTPAGETLTADKLIIGGLPRWDLLKDESAEIEGQSVVLVMLTWRASFNKGMTQMLKSAYYNRLKALLSPERLERLDKKGIRIVLAPHHHLSNVVKDLDFGVPVEVIDASQVSYWIRHARMLVTDFSSVSVDFLFQNKPVVYWMLDRDDFLLDPAVHDDGGKVRSAEHEVKALFNVCTLEEEVLAKIDYYAARNFELEEGNRAIAESFFEHKNDICSHVYEAIVAAMTGKGARR